MKSEYDDLKCCGNCKQRNSVDMGEYFEETCLKGEHLESYKICKEWEFDGLIWQKREK